MTVLTQTVTDVDKILIVIAPKCLNELPRGDNRPFYIFIFKYCSYLMAKLIDQVITRSDFRNLQFGS